MTDLNVEFLKDVQRAGWIIEHVDHDVAVAQCPMQGCGMRAKLLPGATVPQACLGTRKLADVYVSDYSQLLAFLSQRRENLALNMPEADEIIGLAHGHIGKLKCMARQPWPATLFDWAAGFGYQIVLRTVGLPPKALAAKAQTGDQAAATCRRCAAKREATLASKASPLDEPQTAALAMSQEAPVACLKVIVFPLAMRRSSMGARRMPSRLPIQLGVPVLSHRED